MRLPSPISVAVLVAVIATETAAASALPTTPAPLAGGSATVSSCDSDGFTYRYSVNTSGQVTSVVVGSVSSTCAGGVLRLTLTNGSTSVGSGSASLPSSGFTGSATISVSPTPLSSGVTALYIAIEGP